MTTLRKLVSTVRGTHKLLSTDSLITDRVIAAEIKNNAFLLIKRETNLRKLFATDTLFTTIPCLELIEVPISECCDYVDDCTVSRSKYKLPKIGEGNYQYVIQGAWSINAMGGKGKKIKYTTINRYTNLLKLPIIKNEEYFWIVNDYLYVSNPMLQAIRLSAFFQEDVPNEIMFPDCDCGVKFSTDDLCKNPLDKNFSLPGYLEKQVMDMVSERLLKLYFNVKTDISNDNIDGQAPNTKPTN